jgi:hypothetical protein
VDASSLRRILEQIDAALQTPTELIVRGGAALLALGFEGRTTVDIDVLPASRFVEADLRRACAAAPAPEGSPYNTVFRGRQLTVRTPPAGDIAVGKRKRLDPEDIADIRFLVGRFGLDAATLHEAFARLPARFRRDPVLVDNLRYVVEDLWGKTP